MTKTRKIIRLAVLCIVMVHLLSMTAFAANHNGFEGVTTWTEGSLTPLTREDGAGTMTITSSNAPADWWKVKVELPRVVEQGKTYEAKFVFTSNVTGPIKYIVDGATYLTSNEYQVQEGENTFAIQFTAGADTYNCLELGGLGAFTLTFSEISVTEQVSQEEPGEHTHNYVNGMCSCGLDNGFAGVQTWTEGSLTPVTREDTENTMTIKSANAPGDWWKVKVELPRTVEAGKTYEAKFVFTSNVTGTIKYHVGDANFQTANEYQVVEGENTFVVRFTAGNDTYNCLELGGLGEFELTFSNIEVAEVVADDGPSDNLPENGDAAKLLPCLAVLSVAGMAICVLYSKKNILA